MVPAERYLNATGAAFDIIKSESQLSGAIFGEVAMTCLVTMVVLLVAVNGKTKTPLAPFLVGCTVIVNVLAGWEKLDHQEQTEHLTRGSGQEPNRILTAA